MPGDPKKDSTGTTEGHGERLAALETTIQNQNNLIQNQNTLIVNLDQKVDKKLDSIETLMRNLVTRENCKEKREATEKSAATVEKRLDVLEKRDKEMPPNLASRLLALEAKTPAIIQYIAVAFFMGIIFWGLDRMFP